MQDGNRDFFYSSKYLRQMYFFLSKHICYPDAKLLMCFFFSWGISIKDKRFMHVCKIVAKYNHIEISSHLLKKVVVIDRRILLRFSAPFTYTSGLFILNTSLGAPRNPGSDFLCPDPIRFIWGILKYVLERCSVAPCIDATFSMRFFLRLNSANSASINRSVPPAYLPLGFPLV